MQNQTQKAFTALSLSAAIALPGLYHAAQAAPRRGGGKTTGTTTTGTANRPAPTPGARDVKMLEAALGRMLTDEEIVQVNALQATRDAAISAAFADYNLAVAAAVGLSVDELDAKIQANRPVDGGGRGGGRR